MGGGGGGGGHCTLSGSVICSPIGAALVCRITQEIFHIHHRYPENVMVFIQNFRKGKGNHLMPSTY